MKKTAFCFVLVLLCAQCAIAQNAIKIGAKVNASSLTNNMDIDLGKRTLWTVAPSLSLDYLSHTYWYLISEIALVTIGGKDNIYNEDMESTSVEMSWKYLEQNTKFRLQYPLNTMSLYAGAGMYIRERVSNATCEIAENASLEGASFLFGEVFEGGITTVKGKLKADFNVYYYLRNNHISKPEPATFYPNTWGLGLSVGYIL